MPIHSPAFAEPLSDRGGETPMAMMARAMRVVAGVVPHHVGGKPVGEGEHYLGEGEYLLRTLQGVGFHYRQGDGVTVERAEGADPRDEELFLKGSVYAAVAAINGLYPMHASAVAHQGQVHAFTGPSGAGKSTLIAELGRRGMPMFCDDTLVLDLSDPARPMCLPGHKRLKLCPDALAMTGAAAQERVSTALDKHYAAPAAGAVAEMLPLVSLCFLEHGEPARIEPVRGAETLRLLQDDHYTTEMVLDARLGDRVGRFAQLAGLARALAITRFIRPRDVARFAGDVALVERAIADFSIIHTETTP